MSQRKHLLADWTPALDRQVRNFHGAGGKQDYIPVQGRMCWCPCAGVPALQFFRVWSREGCACWDAFPAVWWRRGVLAELASSDKAPGGDRSKHAVRISFPRSYMRQRCSSITCSAGSFLLLTTKYANRAVALPAFLVFWLMVLMVLFSKLNLSAQTVSLWKYKTLPCASCAVINIHNFPVQDLHIMLAFFPHCLFTSLPTAQVSSEQVYAKLANWMVMSLLPVNSSYCILLTAFTALLLTNQTALGYNEVHHRIALI